MFTGIIETVGIVTDLQMNQSNLNLSIEAEFVSTLKVDQSIAHNGVCLTVIAISEKSYTVTAIEESLQKTNLGSLKIGDAVNLERCLQFNQRLDGHLVQGHVDQTARCNKRQEMNGSTIFGFSFESNKNLVIEKGSICVNGISLTVINASSNSFDVAIIPYTFEHTTMKYLQVGDQVNLEFDIIGKYIQGLLQSRL